MDRSELTRRVLLKLTTAPTVLGPAVIGASAAAIGLAAASPVLLFAGAAGVLLGGGIFASRWAFGFDRLVAREAEYLGRREEAAQRRALRSLELRLRGDGDARTERWLRQMTAMRDRFEADQDAAIAEGPRAAARLAEVAPQVDELFDHCIESLERSLRLNETARRMHTSKMRRRTLEAREAVLDEVERSIDHLALVLDRVAELGVMRDADGQAEQRMSSIRAELDA
ncbi:MAG: hypothetical protein AB8G96_13880, partial [Phycisphaerales bacterium]